MPLSLKTMLKKFVHKGQITQEEYDALIKKLDGHDKEIRAKAITDYLQFVYDNASNEEYANEDGWAFSDLMDLEYKYLEQLKGGADNGKG